MLHKETASDFRMPFLLFVIKCIKLTVPEEISYDVIYKGDDHKYSVNDNDNIHDCVVQLRQHNHSDQANEENGCTDLSAEQGALEHSAVVIIDAAGY